MVIPRQQIGYRGRGGGRGGGRGSRGNGSRNNSDRRNTRPKGTDHQKKDGVSNKKLLFRPLTDNSHPDETFDIVRRHLKEAIASDAIFKNTTADAQHIVGKLEVPVDGKKPPIKTKLTVVDEKDDDTRKARQEALDTVYSKESQMSCHSFTQRSSITAPTV